MTSPVTVEPTQVRHSSRAALRTVLQALLALATTLPYVIPQIVDATNDTPVGKYVALAAAQILVFAGIAAKLMAIPVVNSWLTSIGVGPTPKPGAHEA